LSIKLIVEVMDHAPTTLTHREKLLLVVLAEDANDKTRQTWNSVERPEILRRAKLTRQQLYEVIRSLIAKNVLKRVSAGQKHATAKYMILPLAPQCPEIPDTEPEVQSPENPDTETAQCPEIRDLSVRESRTPTPQPPHTHPPSPDPRASPTATHGREGGGDASLRDTPAFQALARITTRHPQLAVGEKELHDLAPLAAQWLERTTADRLEQALTAGLPREIGSPAGLLRKRLVDKLPPPPAADTGEPRCTDPRCDPVTHMLTLPNGDIDFCPTCHPTGRARARRQAQGRST
jgi:hypothetical protein